MALMFRPNRAVYDSASGVVWFFAADGPMFVRCGVSKNALLAINGACPKGAAALEGIYERHRKRIQEAAARKHRAQQFGKPGINLTHQQDVAD